MKAKCLNWLLMAVLICGFSWSVTACSDDDDENKTSEQRNDDADPLDTDEAQVAWRWLCALTDAQKLESNWSKKSYEPTVGVESENNKNTRIVVVANPDMVKKYAANDKWVRLPYPNRTNEAPGPRNQPRTQAETSAKSRDYIWSEGKFATTKTNMFNEPVLFFRIMYVEDNGEKKTEFTSTDHRKLTIVHTLNSSFLYKNLFQSKWAGEWNTFNVGGLLFLDNKNLKLENINGI